MPDVMSGLRRTIRSRRLRRSVRRFVELLPVGGGSILRLARAAESGVLDHGKDHVATASGLPPVPPIRFRLRPHPAAVRGPFDEPPRIEHPGRVFRSIAPPAAPPPTIMVSKPLVIRRLKHFVTNRQSGRSPNA